MKRIQLLGSIATHPRHRRAQRGHRLPRVAMTSLADQLRPAMTGSSGSLMRVVLRELPTIEAAREAGLSYEEIAAGLTAVGSPVSARVLRELVYRARRRTRIKAARPVSAIPPPIPVTAPTPATVQGIPQVASVHPPSPATTAATSNLPVGGEPDFIAEILRTPPDLDALARRFRESQRQKKP